MSRKHSLPPGPKGLPFVGNALQFQRNSLTFMTENAKKYGDIFSFRLGTHQNILINHPDLIHRVLVLNQAKMFGLFA